MEFLKVYDEVVKEFGFGIRCGIYSKILEYHLNGATCYMSKKSMAEFMQCKKSTVCDALVYLLEDTEHVVDVTDGKRKRIQCADANGKQIPKEPYIKSIHRKKDDGSADTTVYVINEDHELFKKIRSSSDLGCLDSGQGSPKIGQGVVRKSDNGSPKIGQGVVQNSDKGLSENRTEKENTKRESFNRKSEERRVEQRARAQSPAPDVENSNSSESEELTEEQKDHIKYGFIYPTEKRKHKAAHYLSLYPKYSYDTIIGFLEDDTTPRSKADEWQARENEKQIEDAMNQGKVQLYNGEWIDGKKDDDGIIHLPDGKMIDELGYEVW